MLYLSLAFAAAMGNQYHYISDFRANVIDNWTINVTVSRVWATYNPKNDQHISLDIIIVEERLGKGMSEIALPDRAAIANMSPEYGATMRFFPVDHVTLQYLKMVGRSVDTISMIETYLGVNKLFMDYSQPEGDMVFSSHLKLNLQDVEPCVSGPKRYCILGDGCQMEGIANEACSLAGHWRLGRLIAFYDDNHISIHGNTDIAFY